MHSGLHTTIHAHTDIQTGMAQQTVIDPDGKFHRAAHTIKPTSLKTSEPVSGSTFEVFSDEQSLATPRCFSRLLSNADFNNLNDENISSVPTFKFSNKSTTKVDSVPSVKRTPLADVTQDVVGRPRSMSNLLAEIARLKDVLELSKDEVKELRGEIVAYQDALCQADEDAEHS
jgi:hypothetical protein